MPKSAAITRSWLARSRAYAAACANTAAKRALLPHLTTLDTVRDMDLIRQALGVDTISYYGFSYGTYLGEVYATRYPSRVGRFVLDGVVNPSRVWYAANLDQDRAFDANMNVFWQYLARHPGAFHLGKRWRAIRRGYYQRAAAPRPQARRRTAASAPTSSPTRCSTPATTSTTGSTSGWPTRRSCASTSGGTLAALYRDANMGDDNSFAMYNAVQCSDAPWPNWARTRASTLGGAPARAVPDLGQHLVQRAVPDLEGAGTPSPRRLAAARSARRSC